MTEAELKERSKLFAHRCLDVVDALPGKTSARTLGNQLARSATSVGANYRAACRSRSKAEFIAKIGIVEEEADECAFWLEMIRERNLIPSKRLVDLLREATELTAIMAASRKTAKSTR
jgi:four helix bundle protein